MDSIANSGSIHETLFQNLVHNHTLEDGELIKYLKSPPCQETFRPDPTYTPLTITLPSSTSSSPSKNHIYTYLLLNKSLLQYKQTLYIVAVAENGQTIGKMHGTWLNRPLVRSLTGIKNDIHTICSSRVLTDIFDGNGNFKGEFFPGSEKEGSGKWSTELNSGSIFLVNWVQLSKEYRGCGLGSKMFKILLEKGGQLGEGEGKGWDWALLEYMAPRGGEHGDTSKKEMQETTRKSLGFYRKNGFRRVGLSKVFGLARDEVHLSRDQAFTAEEDARFDRFVGSI